MRVSAYCETCLARVPLGPDAGADAARDGEEPCPRGHGAIAFRHSAAVATGAGVDTCSRCGKTAFFVQKDFDQRLGCALLAGGAVVALGVARLFGGIWFVPALLVFAAADLVAARRVKSVVICYACDTEYRDVPDVASYKPYDPHVAERHAELKTVRRMNP